MNANTHNIDVVVEQGQVEETVLSIFHTILLHRTTGKFCYRHEETYSVGTVGTVDVDCELLNFTYVRISSKALDAVLQKYISAFATQLSQPHCEYSTGTITLQFYQKKRNHWPFNDECVPWEIWNLQVTERHLLTENERTVARETACLRLGEKIMSIVEAVGRHDFTPKMPTQTNLPLVFDTSFQDVQPYLFHIYHSIGKADYERLSGNKATSVGLTVRRLFRDAITT